MNWKDKTVFLTGASSGIGAALAEQLARPGVSLGLIGRDVARLEGVGSICRAKGADCRTISLDVRKAVPLAAFIAEFDQRRPIDLLVSNAGILDGRRDGEVVENGATARRVLEINLLAAVDVVHAVLPHMRRRRRGDIRHRNIQMVQFHSETENLEH